MRTGGDRGALPLEQAYSFEPVGAGLEADAAAHILGAQGNLWTEYIREFDHLTYMALPRAAALAEAVWSPPNQRDYGDFLRRWGRFATILDEMGVRYRPVSDTP